MKKISNPFFVPEIIHHVNTYGSCTDISLTHTTLLYNLPYRQMATPITPIKTLMGIWKIAMETITDEIENLKSAWKNTSEQQLFHELETEYGFPRATCRSLVQLMHEFIEQNYGNQREDKQIIYHAVSKDEPPGKQLDKINIVPVKLTIAHPEP
jgi:hypothetical protein